MKGHEAERRPARDGEMCTCGRTAVLVLVFDGGPVVREVPWCGVSELEKLR